ncbi:glycosyl transferase [Streptomyces mashuensis]|uniref:Glycosyl transferase n=1 Tax=Streptomyces mashuensis TaxID=33904 RepID=A0A919B7U7_9ACTN|nr:glycosyltransferase [Streptomyces mashuensis]GHF64899.1 glycosyl transferase [Streptomyces mashuensis]
MTAPEHGPEGGIGVVIATRDRADRLATTLDLLTALPEDPEIVVVDNASTDDTPTMVRTRFPRVRLLRLPHNKGALARTYGVLHLRTPVVAFCDDDSWWAPGSLARAARLMSEHPRLGLLAAHTLVGPGRRPDPLNEVLAASPLGREPDLPGPSVLGFLACAAVVRREAYLQTGGFHPLLFFAGEESLLAYDLAARGWGVVHCPDVVAHHHPAAARPRPGRRTREARNELLTVWLRRPLPVALRRTLALAATARHDPDARAALAETLARLPAALAHRRTLPPELEADLRLLERPAPDGPPRRP